MPTRSELAEDDPDSPCLINNSDLRGTTVRLIMTMISSKKTNDFAQDRTGDVLRVKQMP